eukprot:TRINITY_DN21845_c0_g2_i1.p1 TRINITY_DN21845_c0_g2~~TRINITY_DN21845_c0_g2_i1.p1  ORF type:complete len:272 (+),score=39.83 TRINITY_DN21845_c0_g2_i1:2-817(+)
MSAALRPPDIIYYLDHGNPTSPMKVYNPRKHHIPTKVPEHPVPGTAAWNDAVGMTSQALTPDQLGWTWGGDVAHMMKVWYDRQDSWDSFLSNIHSQIRLAEYQHCGFFLAPDGLTVGMGGMTPSQDRAQFLMYAVLGAPLVLFADIRRLSSGQMDLLTSPEVLSVNQDRECVMASLTQARGATEAWVKPLSDGSFAVVLLNKGVTSANVTLTTGNTGDSSDFFPAYFERYVARDLMSRSDLGDQHGDLVVEVPGMDARMIKISPSTSRLEL